MSHVLHVAFQADIALCNVTQWGCYNATQLPQDCPRLGSLSDVRSRHYLLASSRVSMRLYMYTCMCMHTWYVYIYICECSSACLYLQRLKREKCMRLLGHASYTSKVSPDKLEGWSPPWAHLQVRNYEWMMTDQKDQKDMANLLIQCGLKRPHPEWSYKMGITIQFGFKSGWGSVKTSRGVTAT